MFNDKFIPHDLPKLEAFRAMTEDETGYTVGRSAKILGMSRQAITKAIERDALHATRLYLVGSDGSKKLISTEVDRASVHALAEAKFGRQRAPMGYLDNQHRLFS